MPSPTIIGVVKGIVPTPVGKKGKWYNVDTLFGQTLKGGSIKGTTFSPGQKVDIISCGLHPILEYGFIEYGHGSAYLVPDSAREQAIAWSKAAVAASCIGYLAGNKQLRYRPATVTAIGTGLTVTDRWTKKKLNNLPIEAPLLPSDFKIGDVILIQHNPLPFDMVIGWWYPADDGDDVIWMLNWWPGAGIYPSMLCRYVLGGGHSVTTLDPVQTAKLRAWMASQWNNAWPRIGGEGCIIAQTEYTGQESGANWMRGHTYLYYINTDGTIEPANIVGDIANGHVTNAIDQIASSNSWEYPRGINLCYNTVDKETYYALHVSGIIDTLLHDIYITVQNLKTGQYSESLCVSDFISGGATGAGFEETPTFEISFDDNEYEGSGGKTNIVNVLMSCRDSGDRFYAYFRSTDMALITSEATTVAPSEYTMAASGTSYVSVFNYNNHLTLHSKMITGTYETEEVIDGLQTWHIGVTFPFWPGSYPTTQHLPIAKDCVVMPCYYNPDGKTTLICHLKVQVFPGYDTPRGAWAFYAESFDEDEKVVSGWTIDMPIQAVGKGVQIPPDVLKYTEPTVALQIAENDPNVHLQAPPTYDRRQS